MATHSRRVSQYVWPAIFGYAAVMGLLAYLGVYVFVIKTLVMPWLVAIGIGLTGTKAFVRDWAVPISVVALFDSARGWIYAGVLAWNRPVHADYVIAWERNWFGTILPVALQGSLRQPWLDSVAVLVHATHFIFFIAFGFVLWVNVRELFAAFARGLYVVLILGLLTYTALPTVPPWMAAAPELAKIDSLERIASSVYTHKVPTLVAGLDTNPVAAMPSLHVALPAYCALVGATVATWPTVLWLYLYVGAVSGAALYLGEHYGVDVFAGWLLALGAFWYYRRVAARTAPLDQRARSADIIAAALMVTAIGLSVWAGVLLSSIPPP